MLKLTKKKKIKKCKTKKIKEIIVKKYLTDEEILEKEGHFFNLSDFKLKINYSCDVYYIIGNRRLL